MASTAPGARFSALALGIRHGRLDAKLAMSVPGAGRVPMAPGAGLTGLDAKLARFAVVAPGVRLGRLDAKLAMSAPGAGLVPMAPGAHTTGHGAIAPGIRLAGPGAAAPMEMVRKEERTMASWAPWA